MKKIFKALSVLVAGTALCAGAAFASACSGYSGTYYGEYHYISANSPYAYGMVVEVTVENNIITAVKDLTNSDNENAKQLQTYKDVIDGKEADEETYHSWTTVSAGWENYIAGMSEEQLYGMRYYAYTEKEMAAFEDMEYAEVLAYIKKNPAYYYGWMNSNASNWTDHTSWLLQQYVGWSVADVLAIDVYTNYGYTLTTKEDGSLTQTLDTSSSGEPYATAYNTELQSSGLLITGSTQGSGRLILAVQNALGK